MKRLLATALPSFFARGTPTDFAGHTAAPDTDEQASRWQAHNRDWWAAHPMRYDFGDGPLDAPEFSPAFFAEADRRFLASVWAQHPWRAVPFDDLIPYCALRSQAVLEIGVGVGLHAQLLALFAGTYTGIDLTEYATRATTARLRLAGLPGTVRQMDAERLTFTDESFDFVWSWGVIHHSSDTRAVLGEIARVLRPGGRCTVMVYHHSPYNTWVRAGLFYGVLRGGFFRGRTVAQLLQDTTDGALARYYTRDEWTREVGDRLRVTRLSVIGHKTQFLPFPAGRIKNLLGRLIPDPLGRWLTNRPSVGYMLVAEMEKPAH